MYYKNYEELIIKVKNLKNKKRVVLVEAQDEHSLQAICQAKKEHIVDSVLVGDKKGISKILKKLGEKIAEYHIVGIEEDQCAVTTAVNLINNGEADFIMKGKIETADLLRGVVKKDSNLRTGNIMSHLAFLELPGYHKLLALTDAGMIINPDIEQKVHIIENTINIFQKLGCENPKIAVLTAVEKVSSTMQDTLDAAALKIMNRTGIIKDCIIEGPISYDLAMSKEIAKIKGYESPYCGDFDVLLVPNITTGNVLSKALIFSAGAKMAGFIVGAKVPITLTSRGATAEEKYLSLVLTASVV